MWAAREEPENAGFGEAGLMEWTPPGGFYRSLPIRPRWNGPGWGTVLLAGAVVAAMGWMLLAERARGNAPSTVGAAAGEPAAAVVSGTGGGTVPQAEERRVAVAWERKAGTEKDVRDGAGSRRVEPVLERTETASRKTAPRKAAPRGTGPERQAKRAWRPAKPVEAVKRKKHRESARPVRAGRPGRSEAPARGAGRPAENVWTPENGVFSGFVGHECEKQLAGAGPFCSLVVNRVFSAGQAHGGR
jgi:hypothetical protein